MTLYYQQPDDGAWVFYGTYASELECGIAVLVLLRDGLRVELDCGGVTHDC